MLIGVRFGIRSEASFPEIIETPPECLSCDPSFMVENAHASLIQSFMSASNVVQQLSY
jgi:hypothetical protein